MFIRRLKIKEFRNLKDFEIAFSETAQLPAGETKALKSHAIIGQNGSGKSNLLEVIITIFRDLDLDNVASLDYEMEYELRGHVINLEAMKGKKPKVLIDGEKSSTKIITDNPHTYLPAHIFAYYSGKNQRIEELFYPHLERFNKKMRSGSQEYMPAHLLENFDGTEASAEKIKVHEERVQRARQNMGNDELRRLFYCRGPHTQLVLLSCLLSDDPVFRQLTDDLGIIELGSALFVLKQPHYLKSRLDENDIANGDSRFWYAGGTVVSEFLDKLWDVAIAPIDQKVQKRIDFRGRREQQEQLYLFVPDNEKLKELGEKVGPPKWFFRYAEGAYIGDLIDEVRITVKHKDVEGNISFDQLSEGEVQLLTVLGLMRITSQDHCLFLLDEPDTHLNPIWKLRYFDDIERIIKQEEGKTLAGDSQIIITTHDPMMVGSLRKEQVRILRNERGRSAVDEPDEHPQGMGVAGLLKSDLFGLRSTLDSETRRRLDKRNYLYALGRKRTQSQDEELSRLSDELSDLGFSSDFRDPYFELFVQKMAIHTKFHKEILTPEEKKEQDAIADEIIDEILREEGAK
ncbi:AAA family ATPase [Methylobacter sp. BlB1]|uniref:AAA family ATPase n=1 Tax=Methylobacter sp. BlB1 TaxID=2785914 RepID=UPI0018952774|nr:AAA family ATPase [Methylobacter sp. BlB1]MBF6650189.1 AAA family ATPase [Methylobacter sp. BlB1]